MSKPFDPFASDDDDALEFHPDASPGAARPPTGDTRVLGTATAPTRRDRPLRLDFSELDDQGGDTRGATALGAERLESDSFLRGVKRRDYDEAMARAQRAQSARPRTAADAGRVARKVNTPLYLLTLGVLVFIGLLVAGGFAFKRYQEHRASAQVEAIERAHP